MSDKDSARPLSVSARLALKGERHNPLYRISSLELQLFPSGTDAEVLEIRGDCHLGTEEFTEGDYEFKLKIKRAWLRIARTGYDIALGSRYGNLSRSNSHEVTTEEKHTSTKKGSAAGKAGVKFDPRAPMSTGGEFSVSASGEVGAERERTEKSSRVDVHQIVTAKGGDEWVIQEPNGWFLDGNYLGSECVLCRLEKEPGANYGEVRVQTIVQKKDFVIEITKRPPFHSENKARERILAIVIAKALAASEGENSANEVCLSLFEATPE